MGLGVGVGVGVGLTQHGGASVALSSVTKTVGPSSWMETRMIRARLCPSDDSVKKNDLSSSPSEMVRDRVRGRGRVRVGVDRPGPGVTRGGRKPRRTL